MTSLPGAVSISFFDVDAHAELCRVHSSPAMACPRLAEHVDFRADLEQGGGLYLVVGVRHIVEPHSMLHAGREASVTGVVVELKPIHSALLEKESAVALELPIEEIVSLPLPPEPTLN